MSNAREFKTLTELDLFCQRIVDGECQFDDGRLDEQVALAGSILPLTTLIREPFPIIIEHRDRPDFLIAFNQTLVAIEVVRLIARSRAHASAVAGRKGVGLLRSRYKFSTPEMSRDVMEKSVSLPCTGVADFEPVYDEEYVDAFVGCVNDKKKKILQQPDCCITGADNWLLIKDEHRLRIDQADYVVDEVQKRMCCHWSNFPHFSKMIFSTNSKLFVLDGRVVLSSPFKDCLFT